MELDDFNREVPCYCRRSVVVSRMSPEFDAFAVCSRDCFDRMVSDHPNYFEVIYGPRHRENLFSSSP